jgi:hypothetical protein
MTKKSRFDVFGNQELWPDSRFYNVEVKSAGELGCVSLMVVWLSAALAKGYPILFLTVAFVVLGFVLRSFLRTRSERERAWEDLIGWEQQPIEIHGDLVRQVRKGRSEAEEIDTKQGYSVRWFRFGEGRAVYTVSQGPDEIKLSTLWDGAEHVIVKVFGIKNYPCQDWPSFDM